MSIRANKELLGSPEVTVRTTSLTRRAARLHKRRLRFREPPPNATACVWELPLLTFERDAWVINVMGDDGPNLTDYRTLASTATPKAKARPLPVNSQRGRPARARARDRSA
jgi:hypothetical protein